MKKTCFITLAVILMCSCAKDIKTATQIHQRSKSHDNIEVIPVEKALNTLERFLSENALAPTKSNMPRKYGKVSVYYTKGNGTKSEGDGIPTAYIVNFDNDEGFAVLGANSRVPDIVAVTEKGHINPNDLTCGIGAGAVTKAEAEETQKPDNNNYYNYNCLLGDMDESEIEEFNKKATITRDSLLYSIEDEDYFVGDIRDYITDSLKIPTRLIETGLDTPFTDDGSDDNGDNNGGDNNGGDGNGENNGGDGNGNDNGGDNNGGNDGSNPGSGSDSGSGDDNSASRKYNIKEPMLTYSWGQESPYNKECKRGLFKTKYALTGCSTTAMAMIVAYNEFPNNLTVNGTHIDYSGIKSQKTGQGLSDRHKHQLAVLMSSIFDCVAKLTGSKYTLITPRQIQKRMEEFQYSNVVRTIEPSLSDETIGEISRMLGENKPVFISAIPKKWEDAHSWVIDGAKYSPDDTYLLHMNFGWEGECNGYFATDCLNPNKGKEYDTSKSSTIDDGDYCWHFRVITYDIPTEYWNVTFNY